MAVPTRIEAARILRDLDPPEWFMAHSATVAEVAAFLAERIAGRDMEVDRALVEAAALLHDVDKLLPADHPLRQRGHGRAGASWLAERGHPELARAVAGHPVTVLGDDGRYRQWAAVATLEERVVAYADKRAAQDLVAMEQRFDDWLARHPEHADSLRLARDRAERLEREVCAAAAIEPAQVVRLPWVEEALAASRAAA